MKGISVVAPDGKSVSLTYISGGNVSSPKLSARPKLSILPGTSSENLNGDRSSERKGKGKTNMLALSYCLGKTQQMLCSSSSSSSCHCAHVADGE